jgi:hypothetical protein
MCYHCGSNLCSIAEPIYLPVWLTTEVTAIQIELAHLLGLQKEVVQLPHVIAIDTAEINLIRTASHAMQASLHEAYARQAAPTSYETFEKLAGIVRILDFSPIAEIPGPHIGVGIDAKALFGRAAAPICGVLMEHQNLFGTTLWWSGENLLKNALRETWANEDFDQTKRWVLRHCGPNRLPESDSRS